MSWSEGYVTEIDYTGGYYRELSPAIIDFALLSKRLMRQRARPLRYLELGSGQGVSLNVNAALHEGEFWGCDFMPSQVLNARALAEASGNGAKFFEDSFQDFAFRSDLPQFDMIVLHGIYSWISVESREAIHKIVKNNLAPGGIVYLSYNTQPGWAESAPLQHLMALFASTKSDQPILDVVTSSLQFVEKIADAGAQYFKANPLAAMRLANIKSKNKSYLAHEYFNQNWHPLPFSIVAKAMKEAKLDFGASAFLSDHVDSIHLGPEAQKMLGSMQDPVLQQTVRDYFVNQQFRRDLFVKGLKPVPEQVHGAAVLNSRFMLHHPFDHIPLQISGNLGTRKLPSQTLNPLIEVLDTASDKSMSVRELGDHPSMSSRSAKDIFEALFLLSCIGIVSLRRDDEATESSVRGSSTFNRAVRRQTIDGYHSAVLASPATGQGVFVDRAHQIFLEGESRGIIGRDDLLRFAHTCVNPKKLQQKKSELENSNDSEVLSGKLEKSYQRYQTVRANYMRLMVG
jgi:cyclopropane fatty-acyl-phospholipid synthase-like methyltransferase